jgi:hypothetical protein
MADEPRRFTPQSIGLGVAIGVAIGAGLGVVFDNLAVGVGVGWLWVWRWVRYGVAMVERRQTGRAGAIGKSSGSGDFRRSSAARPRLPATRLVGPSLQNYGNSPSAAEV